MGKKIQLRTTHKFSVEGETVEGIYKGILDYPTRLKEHIRRKENNQDAITEAPVLELEDGTEVYLPRSSRLVDRLSQCHHGAHVTVTYVGELKEGGVGNNKPKEWDVELHDDGE